MANVTRTIYLTGGRAGQTCDLNHGRFHFTNGKLVLRGDGARVAALVRILADQYQAYEAGSLELEAANGERDIPKAGEGTEHLLGGVRPAGQGTAETEAVAGGGADGTADDPGAERDHTEGDGHPDPRLARIQVALDRLDHGKDAYWTCEGLPKVSVIKKRLKDETLTRADIDKAAPNFQREGYPHG